MSVLDAARALLEHDDPEPDGFGSCPTCAEMDGTGYCDAYGVLWRNLREAVVAADSGVCLHCRGTGGGPESGLSCPVCSGSGFSSDYLEAAKLAVENVLDAVMPEYAAWESHPAKDALRELAGLLAAIERAEGR